ncbi:MAG TPA: ABC transporter ATP-binding protein [Paraburkholderia sp.]|jgi:NitT/TauT family transport system ATP-binding protein|uniref:ABC transporter ATP-binding protein n=1 Tax=Paraburkholderia sp. TaxID=1926495 RepID=UPI002DEC40EF|nr:ABC transporter ATP-binding protein [Paraburkholderia sp.]
MVIAQATPLEATKEATKEATRPGARIDIRHVSHGFALRGETLPVLDDVSLTVAPGEFVALLGPSGCGKSTLLRLVAGLETPGAGTVEAGGVPVRAPDPSRVLVFQDPTLFPWRTVRENVGLGPQAQGARRGPRAAEAEARIDAALERVGLTQFAHAWPHQLSGGMAQRAALARGLVNDPALLALDEPFGKLDSLTRMRMQAELVALWQRERFSVLFVTHDVEEALVMARRVVVFSARPARIVSEVRNDAPYPRHRDDPALVELRRAVLAQLGLEA